MSTEDRKMAAWKALFPVRKTSQIEEEQVLFSIYCNTSIPESDHMEVGEFKSYMRTLVQQIADQENG